VLLELAVIAAPALDSAAIRIELGPDRVTITASYRFTEVPTARFVLIRLPDQTVELGPDSAEAQVTPGLWRLTKRPDDRGLITFRYAVLGRPERLPIPVPTTPAPAGTRSVEMSIQGLDPALELGDAFPRFSRGPAGATARLANVPSLVRLPERGGWSVVRATDGAVLVLLAAAALAWVVRAVRSRRPA
jgi:hypothetical protein